MRHISRHVQALLSCHPNTTNSHTALPLWCSPTPPRARTPLTHFAQSLEGHSSAITALDFSEPYGTLVTASQDDAQPRVWDLMSGEELGRLRGHRGTVKCVQVEDTLCLTGGDDGNVGVWDLRRVDEDDEWERESAVVSLSDVAEEDEGVDELGMRKPEGNGAIRQGGSAPSSVVEKDGPCIRLLEGHTKAVTALYFEDECLVSCFYSRVTDCQ